MNKTDFRYTQVSEAINTGKPQPCFQHKLAIGVMALGLALSTPAQSAGIWVNTLNAEVNPSDGKCSLIEAIDNANADAKVHPDCQKGNGADTIHLWRKNTYTLNKVHNTTSTGSNGLPVITSPITINGKGATIERKRTNLSDFKNTYIAEPGFRLFEVSATGNLSIKNAVLKDGGYFVYINSPGSGAGYHPSGPGGAVFNAGKVELINCRMNSLYTATLENTGSMIIQNTTVEKNNSLTGRGVRNSGNLTILSSTIASNHIGVSNTSSGIAHMQNCTISNNNYAVINDGHLKMSNCTISGNGKALRNTGNSELMNNLVTGNTGYGYYAYHGYIIYNSGSVISNNNIFGNNAYGLSYSSSLESYLSKGFVPGLNDIVATIDGNHPMAIDEIVEVTDSAKFNLVIPKDNGGVTETIALVPGSIAIDAANNADCPATDQRGVARPQGSGCDIGAFELEVITPPVAQVCEVRRDYAPERCEDSVQVSTLDQLKSYRESNFGFMNGNYKNLSITASLDAGNNALDIESPCNISVNPGVALNGSFVSVDGKDGVQMLWGSSIESTGAACILSSDKSAILKGSHTIKARDLVVEAPLAAEIGWDSVVTTDGPTVIRSVSNDVLSRAEIKGRSQIDASTLIIKSAGRTAIGYQSTVTARKDIKMFSNRGFDHSLVSIDWEAKVQAGNDLFLSSAATAKISSDTTVTVGNNLKMNGRNTDSCLVGDTADITYASRSGNCADELP